MSRLNALRLPRRTLSIPLSEPLDKRITSIMDTTTDLDRRRPHLFHVELFQGTFPDQLRSQQFLAHLGQRRSGKQFGQLFGHQSIDVPWCFSRNLARIRLSGLKGFVSSILRLWRGKSRHRFSLYLVVLWEQNLRIRLKGRDGLHNSRPVEDHRRKASDDGRSGLMHNQILRAPQLSQIRHPARKVPGEDRREEPRKGIFPKHPVPVAQCVASKHAGT